MHGIPFLRRNEDDIRDMLYGYIPILSIKPKKNQPVPPSGYLVQTMLSVKKRIPTGINIDIEGNVSFIRFKFLKLPPKYCLRCRKLGHSKED